MPRVVVTTGVGSVAVDDIRSQLREAEQEIHLEVVRVAVTRPAEVARALRQAAGASLVVLTRGGGEGLGALDDERLIGAVASSAVPVVVGVGHAPDDLVFATGRDRRAEGREARAGLRRVGPGPVLVEGRLGRRPLGSGSPGALRAGGRSTAYSESVES